ncbi:bifunctional diaminohydroxyphosphoribosylaminopyrimidine deaminase/5-amino-6-(5-phosphoribosylamino)uracil reductase RibD [Neisseria sp.]|uniref:bifunctional diaminohydroxyphosphoribosylaminopyrimidine deaminase/5-amino-6-(5-phosphoribosylamino)uracil reductase RibD n=1 Tax=Neisseria sp. TaxID=192066 RepID=UPI0034C62A8C
MFSELDTQMMRIALSLARQGLYSTSPNPRVGCVIARGSQIVGQGFHLKAGEPHAEVHALRQAGRFAEGATAYVTLEPCSHHGRTPPCALALIEAGIQRVVCAMRDPNPLVAGKGFALLENAGIGVAYGLLENEARTLNRGFLSRIERERPFFRLKCAASLDGKTALSDGSSKWITGPEARADVQKLRSESCAVLTGIGTILTDDPLLNVRDFPTLRQPARIILDSRLRTPLHSRIIQDKQSPTLIITLNANEADHAPFLKFPHVRIMATKPAHSDGGIDLHELSSLLAVQGYGEVLIEAGAKINSSFIRANLVDEIILYQSPKILGAAARNLFTLPENHETLLQKAPWSPTHCSIMGNDLKICLALTNNQ